MQGWTAPRTSLLLHSLLRLCLRSLLLRSSYPRHRSGPSHAVVHPRREFPPRLLRPDLLFRRARVSFFGREFRSQFGAETVLVVSSHFLFLRRDAAVRDRSESQLPTCGPLGVAVRGRGRAISGSRLGRDGAGSGVRVRDTSDRGGLMSCFEEK